MFKIKVDRSNLQTVVEKHILENTGFITVIEDESDLRDWVLWTIGDLVDEDDAASTTLTIEKDHVIIATTPEVINELRDYLT